MAVLDRIVVQNFRNIELAELDFSSNLNCISGDNGEGKTNLLDAIYYLSMTKSAFALSDRFVLRYGCSEFALSGTYSMDNGTKSVISMKVSSGGEKHIKRDEKPYKKASAHLGLLPIVMVSPSDTALVSESGQERRRFVNAVLSQMDRQYLADLQQYNRLLAQRNKMLKDSDLDLDLLGVFDERMSLYADAIHCRRKAFVQELNPVVAEYYKLLSGGHEKVSIEYQSDLDGATLSELLARGRERDIFLKYTGSGVQKDELSFLMDGHPMRRCGSQGQQKSFLVSLKFAQYDLMKDQWGFAPILLLDDVFDKLDMRRISNLLSMVAGRDFGQIFISDSNKLRLQGIVERITQDSVHFEAKGGAFIRL